MEVIIMATESFEKTFIVNHESEECMERILKETNPLIINRKKSCKQISNEELIELFRK